MSDAGVGYAEVGDVEAPTRARLTVHPPERSQAG